VVLQYVNLAEWDIGAGCEKLGGELGGGAGPPF